jgi:hypothetical protein
MTNHLRILSTFSFCLLASSLFAEQPQPAKLYEQGVNAYFGGRSCQADALLSEAIQAKSKDPLAYYFRALALLREGRVAEARGDMLVGANLEARSPNHQAIGAALERIQGSDRLMLEEFRRSARQNLVGQASASETAPPQTTGNQQPSAAGLLSPQRPSTFKETDADVLREKRIVPIEELLRPGGPHSIVDDQAPPAETPANPPTDNAAPASTPAANPFEDDNQKSSTDKTKPAEKTMPTPPQTTPAATPPAATPPAATPPAAVPPTSTPPATPPKTDDNPFG